MGFFGERHAFWKALYLQGVKWSINELWRSSCFLRSVLCVLLVGPHRWVVGVTICGWVSVWGKHHARPHFSLGTHFLFPCLSCGIMQQTWWAESFSKGPFFRERTGILAVWHFLSLTSRQIQGGSREKRNWQSVPSLPKPPGSPLFPSPGRDMKSYSKIF